MATLTQLTIDADGTIDTTNIIDSDTDAAYFDDCNDVPNGVSSDYIEHNAGLADGTYTAWFSLSNVDADFGSMDTLSIDVDVEIIGTPSNDTVDLTARIFAADNDTGNPLTAETTALGDESDTTRVQRNVAFGTLAGTKAQWDAAHIRFSFAYDRVSGPDSFTLRFYGCDIDGTYTVDSGPSLDAGDRFSLMNAVARSIHFMPMVKPDGTLDEGDRLHMLDLYSRIGADAPSGAEQFFGPNIIQIPGHGIRLISGRFS